MKLLSEIYQNHSYQLHVYNIPGEVGDIRFHVERWKALEEIERQELHSAFMEHRWIQIDAIWNLVKDRGYSFEPVESEIKVYKRWTKLKEGK